MKKYLLIGSVFAGTLLTVSAMAAIYSYRDASGNLVYTDNPMLGGQAQEIELQDTLTVLPGFKPETPTTPANDDQDLLWVSWEETGQPVVLPSVEIIKPQHDQSIWSGSGDLGVSVELSPGLDAGQEIALVVDGRVSVRGQPGQLTLLELPRGSHQLHAEVRDESDQTLASSEVITVHMHRPSVINRNSFLMHPSVADTERPDSAAPAPAAQGEG